MTSFNYSRIFHSTLSFVVAVALTGCGSGGATIGSSGTSPVSGVPGSHATPIPGTSASPAPVPSATPTAGSTTTSTSSVACGAGSPEPAIPYPSATDSDPFYAQPSPFPNLPHGTILQSRTATYDPYGTASMTNTTYQLKFVSCDAYNQPIAAVATAVEPLTPASPEAMLVQSFAEDALGPQCAPSHNVTGAMTDSNVGLDLVVPTGALAAGYTMLFPDHEGPYSEYVAGAVEGHIVLDSIAAAEHFAPLGLNAKSPVGMYGYSGGAEATAQAASLQQSYAANIDIVGIASGGTPADLVSAFSAVDGTTALDLVDNEGFFDILYMSAIGLNRAYPDFFGPTLSAKGVTQTEAMVNGCIGKDSDGSGGPSGHFADYQSVSNWLTLPATLAVAAKVDLPQPGARPIANYFLYQSVDDEIIPVAGVDNLNKGWCADGSTLEYYRDPAGGDHNSMAEIGAPLVLTYMESRFSGTGTTVPPTSTTCN